MAKKIKFPLILKDGFPARTLEELRENFDLEKIIGYFLDGKLLSWLEARSCYAEIEALKKLNKDEREFHQKLCQILGVGEHASSDMSFDTEAVQEHNRRLAELKQYTADPDIWQKIKQVAFNQEDLADLLDEDVHDIYLCNNVFSIPLRVENKRYIGIGKVTATIRSKERVDFSAKRIYFENIQFDESYIKVVQDTPERIYALGEEAENQEDYADAFKYYLQAAEKKYLDAIFKVAVFYDYGYSVQQDSLRALEWYKKAAEMGHTVAMNNIGAKYEDGKGVEKDIEKAKEWYTKAAETGYAFSMKNLGGIYYFTENNYEKAAEWYKKSAEEGNAYANYMIGWQYEHGQGINNDYDSAKKHYRQASDLGYENSNYLYDPTYRYAYVCLIRQNDINSTRKWLEERYNTIEKKKAFLEYIISKIRDTKICKHSGNVHFVDFFIFTKPAKEIEQIIRNKVHAEVRSYYESVRQAILRYGNEIDEIYNDYLMACIVAGNQNIGISQKNEFVTSVKQQINILLSSFSIPDPSCEIVNSIRLEEGYDGEASGLAKVFGPKPYNVDNGSELYNIFRNTISPAGEDVENSAYGYICSVVNELADNLIEQNKYI